jgi:hypothetical protein
VLEHISLSAEAEDVTFEEDEFKERDDAKGDMDEYARRPAEVIFLILIHFACGLLEALDRVPPNDSCSSYKTEEQEEPYEAPDRNAAKCP